MFTSVYSKFVHAKRDWILVIILAVSVVVNAVNLTGFPSYREDEGTYMSQAWALVHQQQLAPYTYWYDHAPGGWIFIALWDVLFGGRFASEMVVDNGRFFMLILQGIATWLVYRITMNMSKHRSVAAVAALIFSLSPLSIVLHRRVLIDNIMAFWFLLSLYFLTKPLRLRSVVFSAITFAFAVLSKESAIAFFPVFVGIVWYVAHREHRHFAMISWISISLLLISFYPLFALLKGELFPSGTLFSAGGEHVSLIEALRFHANRDSLFFLDPNSSFQSALRDTWLRYGPFFIVMAGISTLVHVLGFRRKQKWPFFIAGLSGIYFLFIIGRQLLDWYIVPLIPLFAISIALFGMEVVSLVKRFLPRISSRWLGYGLSVLVVGAIGVELVQHGYIFTLQQTENQRDAVVWAKEHLQDSGVVLIDNYAFVDLNPKLKDITKTPFHYYWKVDTDPQIRYDVLDNDWNNIRYLFFTPAVPLSINRDDLTMVREAYERSYVVKRFSKHDVLGEGYPVEIREVNNANGTLAKSWMWYKETFIRSDGQVIDPRANNQTTSEGQSYALLRAVWEEDPETFASVLQWTLDHLKLTDRYLFAWLAEGDEGVTPEVLDSVTAADADEDIALALLFAADHWDVPEYEELAKQIIQDIWKHEVVEVLGHYYLTAGSGINLESGYLINPSYVSPAWYRIFAEVDPEHPWDKLADDSYYLLDRMSRLNEGQTSSTFSLVPNWLLIDDGGAYEVAPDTMVRQGSVYGYDAFRLYWRIALDYEWYNSNEALEYLELVAPFFEAEWRQRQSIPALYALDGTPVAQYDDVSTNTGPLAIFSVTNPLLAIDFFSETFWQEFHRDGYWRDPEDYYDQNWGWFATALYAKNTPNLWNGGEAVVRR